MLHPLDVSIYLRWAVSPTAALTLLLAPIILALPTHYLLPHMDARSSVLGITRFVSSFLFLAFVPLSAFADLETRLRVTFFVILGCSPSISAHPVPSFTLLPFLLLVLSHLNALHHSYLIPALWLGYPHTHPGGAMKRTLRRQPADNSGAVSEKDRLMPLGWVGRELADHFLMLDIWAIFVAMSVRDLAACLLGISNRQYFLMILPSTLPSLRENTSSRASVNTETGNAGSRCAQPKGRGKIQRCALPVNMGKQWMELQRTRKPGSVKEKVSGKAYAHVAHWMSERKAAEGESRRGVGGGKDILIGRRFVREYTAQQ
ncbi:hypothetical protein B0H16DRAFT_1835487 [Mycena metata]|uniref:Uncharacterized protein n=1 Tax=Mycena metata TaxID=1033252 RepID=A0AAD7IYK9_9AGAR|nr:hypothetical protein B0H16DRAFT_1835487 [Mycena metata]